MEDILHKKISPAKELLTNFSKKYNNNMEKLLKGIEAADSIVLDPHKSLFLPYGSVIILIKNGMILLSFEQMGMAIRRILLLGLPMLL